MLYKFTSFFTWIYNSLKFLTKAKDGLFWIKDKILGLKKNYFNLEEIDLESAQPMHLKYENDFRLDLSGKSGKLAHITHLVSPESHLTQGQWNKMTDSMVSIPMSEYNEFKNFINKKKKQLNYDQGLSESNLIIEDIFNVPKQHLSMPPFAIQEELELQDM